MNISGVRRQLKKGHTGTFRSLRVGEEIEAADICFCDTFFEMPSETSIGKKCEAGETIVRLEFKKEEK